MNRPAALTLAALLMLAACAKIVPPDGGPRDETPPQLLRIDPPNESIYFSSKTIHAYFDEYIQLSDINNQLIVSPPLRERPDVNIRKRGVVITFNEELLPEVTYTLNFGEGIKDFTEGNPTELIYVFSTGAVLDSLMVAGKVLDAYTGEPVAGVRVMLHKDTTRTAPLEEKPYYFARTNKDGVYNFAYLAPGAYRLFALEEVNMNYLYDDPEERFAFIDTLIVPGTPADSLVLPPIFLSMARDTALYINAFDSDSSGFMRMQINRRWSPEGSLIVSDSALGPVVHFMEPDSLFAWTTSYANAEIEWYFASPTKRDTFDVRSFKPGKQPLGVRTKSPGAVSADPPLMITFDRPVSTIDSSRFIFMRDSVVLAAAPRMGPDPFSVELPVKLEDGGNYRLEVLPGGVISREGWTLDTLTWKVSAHAADHYGRLIIKLTDTDFEGQAILQLYRQGKDAGLPDREIILGNSREVELKRLLPATYRMRLIDDRNRNGKWDPADYMSGIQPERVYNLKDDLSVRSNWDLEIEWSIDP